MIIRLAITTALAVCFAAPTITPAQDKPMTEMHAASDSVSPAPLRIQIALLLDTSNSMDGLIAQAKSQLWMLVNELGEGEKNGQKPQIELALYEYGNSDISVAKGYIRQVLSLTTDLDAVSEELFALSTNGGQEYAGLVISAALDELEWSNNADDMKLIIIAGNEPFTQGPVNFQTACARAKLNNIIIDTIHCGDEKVGIDTQWKAGADCSGGIYMTINQDEETVYVASPYDKEIIDLNAALNATYIGYGARGSDYKARQEVQDLNASSMSLKSVISRAKSKASSQYKNVSWDLVDAYEADAEHVLALPEADMPEALKGMDTDARKAFIEAKAQERTNIQAKINTLEAQRKSFVTKEKANMMATQTLDEIVVTSVRKQAEESGFKYQD